MTSYITITEELNGKGFTPVEKMTLALIHGFSQQKQGVFYGSLAYISWWLGCSQRTAKRTLASLIEKGYVEKGEVYDKGAKTTTYKVIGMDEEKAEETGGQNVQMDKLSKNMDKMSTNLDKMTPNNNSNNKENNKSNPVPPTPNIEGLQAAFAASLRQYGTQYSKEMLQAFYDYWAAPLQNPTKAQRKEGILLNYQTQKTWKLDGRLRTWKRREAEYGKARQSGRAAERKTVPQADTFKESKLEEL